MPLSLNTVPGERVRCITHVWNTHRIFCGEVYIVDDVRNRAHDRIFFINGEWWSRIYFDNVREEKDEPVS